MDKSEPALVPQWLKGASGCGSGSTSQHSTTSINSDVIGVPFSAARHRSLLQSHSFSGTGQNGYDSPRNSTLIDKAHLPSSRRVNGVSDRDRAYANFNRNSSFRGDRDRDAHRFDKDREWERDLDYRDKDQDRYFDYKDKDQDRHFDYRDKDQDRYDSHLWSNLSFASKYETDATLKRSQSMLLSRRTENGSRRSGNELGSIPATGVVGNLVSNINKAAFERNFPSLGSEDRQAGNHSNLTLTTGSNSIRHGHGQGIVGVSELGRASSPSLSSQGPPLTGLVFVADGWSSALADAPVPNGVNNVPLTSLQQTTTAASVSSVTPGIGSSGGLNMAEALVQNPPRVRTPPQLSNETQRLEELILKQSRQLIPMTPSMPKTMGFGPSEKLKPKNLRVIDSSAATSKVGQQISSPHRAVARPETSKVPQSGKLLVLKPAREKNGVLKSVKSDSLSPTKGGNISNMAVGQAAGSGAVGSSSLTGGRKSIILDWKTMPISSMPVSTAVDCGALQRSKDNLLVNEEKKPLPQGQNRSDFFNALRKKASGNFSVPGSQEKSKISMEHKAFEPKSNDVMDSESRVDAKENGLLENVGRNSDNPLFAVELACNLSSNINVASSVIRGDTDTAAESSETGSPTSSNVYCVMGGTEEEEAAFLRSLGWEENAGGEEALTEEEINAFYQQMKSRAVSATLSRGKFPNVVDEMHVGSLENISSEQSSSDSETDDS